MGEWIPVTARGQSIRSRLSEEKWAERAAEAARRAEVLTQVRARVTAHAVSWRAALAEVAPQLGWSAYLHLRRREEAGEGPVWERLLDGRVPPVPARVPEEIRLAACMLRRADRSINTESARTHLSAQFGGAGALSDSALRHIWSDAGLGYIGPALPGRAVGEEVEEFYGGAGLALLAAADAELGLSATLAEAVQRAGTERAALQVSVEPRAVQEAQRDENGHFTAGYNHAWRIGHEPGEADGRWGDDESKRGHVELAKRGTLTMRPQTLAHKLLSMGVTAMLTQRRGFVGLEGPSGAWQGVLGSTAYMPRTLDKALWELGLLGVDEALWETHARHWSEVSRRWTGSGPGWVQSVHYIDGTADPYWTQRYAKSGPVSRVGRVMPCLTRVAVTSGAGVPLLVETYAGAASLKTRLIPVLQRLDAALGPDAQTRRLTVVDSEVGSAGLLWALHESTDRIFITVLKGAVLKGATLRDQGEWQPYRARDELRELRVELAGKGAPPGGISLRGVEMRRAGGRRPTTTLFVTTAHPNDVSTSEVADAYLARWPNQEQLFRDTRNGAGLNHSHGFGGVQVTHVAMEAKKERAARSTALGEARQARAEAAHERLDEGTRALAKPVRQEALRLSQQAASRAARTVTARQAKQAELAGHPTEIFERDTARDSVMTCLKLSAVMLNEWVLKEYFRGLTMEWRTFIEQFVTLPVTVRTTRHRRLVQIHANPRQPALMAQLSRAVEEVNRRHIHRDNRLLVFELLGFERSGSE